jgi:site-specific recombinase XerC
MNKTGTVEAIPTTRAVKVAWHPKELEHLIRILKIARPDWQFVEDLELFYSSGLRIGRLLPNGLYLADMVAYSADLDEIEEDENIVRVHGRRR